MCIRDSINDAGQVAFRSIEGTALYTDGIGIVAAGPQGSYPRALNNRGEVLSYRFIGGYSSYDEYLLYRPGAGTESFFGTYSLVTGLNDSGQISGARENPSRELRAFWTDAGGTAHEVPIDHGSVAMAIGNDGALIGWHKDGGSIRGFAYREDAGITPLASAGGSQSIPFAINDSGYIAGWSRIASGALHPVLWLPDGRVHDLGTFGGESNSFWAVNGWDVNNLGQVVGGAPTGDGGAHAFIFDLIHGLRDLNDLIGPDAGWTLVRATSINNRGQIVASGYRDSRWQTFRLTPTAIPEPGTLALVAVGLVPLVRRRMI